MRAGLQSAFVASSAGFANAAANAPPYDLERTDKQLEHPLTRLRRSRNKPNSIEIDTATTLHGIPTQAWNYILGTRSALEWVLDQYKEKKDELPPIQDLRPYRLADYKEEVITLLKKVCTVSYETTQLISKIERITEK